MSVDLSGEITAIATAVLAVFAIVTAIFAVRAFRKQSQEVSDQASMLKVQSKQLAEQRKINERQTEVLELQAAELRESLEERKREAVERRDAQASQVHIALKTIGKSRKGAPTIEATVVNASERQQPIYDVKLYGHVRGQGSGTPNQVPLGTVLNWEKETRHRDFLADIDASDCSAALTFRDALNVTWMKTPDGFFAPESSDVTPDAFLRVLAELSGRKGLSRPMR